MIDLDAIKARLTAATPGPWRAQQARTLLHVKSDLRSVVSLSIAPPRVPELEIRNEHVRRTRADADLIANAPTDIAALITEVEALRSEVDRLRALVPAPPKTPPPGEVWRHSGTFDIDGTGFAVDLVMVGAHRLIAYYPSNNQDLRNRCGYSPHPVIWVDGAIYWEDGLIATEQEEDFCAEVVEALIRYIQEHGEPPDDFGDLGLDTFGREK